MADIPKGETRSRFFNRKWVSTIALLVFLLPITCYYVYNEPLILPELNQEPLYKVEYLDINEEEYLKLGLTPQNPIKIIPLDSSVTKSQIIHGRFLHITDLHPDEHYKEGSSIDAVCHGGKPSKNSDKASKYGDATKGCDSPMILMEETLAWIKDNLRDKIDFVIWTGDNIRHDSDRKYPRTELKIFEMNRQVAELFENVFHGDHDELDPRDFEIPVIPSLGNNDVYPHNLFSPGPTLQTRELWSIWQDFVPEKQLHIFQKGAYYFNEVIPGKLAVLSINTLYLFRANPLTESCDRKKDPGYELFKWLGITLAELRERNMKVWLSGHVPPIPKNYDISCYRKFAVWVHEYRDIIIGGVYGHMNLDHFIPNDSVKAYKSLIEAYVSNGYEFDDEYLINELDLDLDEIDFDLETQYNQLGFDLTGDNFERNKGFSIYGSAPSNKEAYMATVRESFYADIKGAIKAGANSERYSITNIAASVIPTFNPGMRVWEYNITGLGEEVLDIKQRKPWDEFFENLENKLFIEDEDEEDEDEDYEMSKKKKNKKKKKKKKSPKEDPTLPPKKPTDVPLGPAYVQQLFSPISFVQYYLDLKSVNEGTKPFAYEVEYRSKDKPLNLKSLLVDDFIKLGRKLGRPIKYEIFGKKKKDKTEKDPKLIELWESFVNYAFVSSGYHDE